MVESVWERVVLRDCWTRVFRRSAGWRRTAERTPEERPARKWTVWVRKFSVGKSIGN